MHRAHSLDNATITRRPIEGDPGEEITTVTFSDDCYISFIAHEGARWNGFATEYRSSPGFSPAEIDAARNLAFPDRR